MKRTAAYRFTSDICFYYAILSIFPDFLPLQRPMALFAAASFAVSLAAVYIPWAPLRFVLAALPGLVFLQAKPCFPLAFSALAWLYLILVLTAGRFSVWLEGYRRSFRVMLWTCILSMLCSILLNMIQPGVTMILPGTSYSLAFLCLGVVAMRKLQMNAEMSLRWNLANNFVTVGVPLVAAGCSWLLWRLLLLLRPIGVSLLPLLKRLLAALINALFPINPEAFDSMPTPTPEPTLSPAEEAIVEPGWETPTPQIDFDFEFDPAVLEKARRIGIFALLALLLIVLVILILLRVRRNRAKAFEEVPYEEAEDGVLVRKRKKAESIFARSDVKDIRVLYRKYMQLMRKRGVLIRKDSTSRDILDEAEQISLSPAARRLRELYLAARYGDSAAVGRDEVLEAQSCYEEIRREDSRRSKS